MVYTVVLKRPEWVGSCFGHLDHDIDVSVTTAEGRNAREAVLMAQRKQAMADEDDLRKLCVMKESERPKPKDYRVLVVFEGCHEPKLSGWDLLSDL